MWRGGAGFRRIWGACRMANAPLENSNSSCLDTHDTHLSPPFPFLFVQPTNQQSRPNLTDFQPVCTLGTGSFGRVMLVKEKVSESFRALKILEKAKVCGGLGAAAPPAFPSASSALCPLFQVVKLKQVEHTIYEKQILEAVDFPFLVNLVGSFKDNSNLYMVLEVGPENWKQTTIIRCSSDIRFPPPVRPRRRALLASALCRPLLRVCLQVLRCADCPGV